MPGELADWGAGRALDAAFGRAAPAVYTGYLMLLTGLPASPDTATLADFVALELTTAGYARQAVAMAAPAGSPPRSQNADLETFGPFTANPPSATHAAYVDASSGSVGNVAAHWQLTAAKDADTGESIQVAAGAATMDLD